MLVLTFSHSYSFQHEFQKEMVLVTVRITVMVTVIVSMTLDALIGRCILYFSSVAPLSLGSYHLVDFAFQM